MTTLRAIRMLLGCGLQMLAIKAVAVEDLPEFTRKILAPLVDEVRKGDTRERYAERLHAAIMQNRRDA